MQKKHEKNIQNPKSASISRKNLIALIESLLHTIQSLTLSTNKSQWVEYYTFTNYSDTSFDKKKEIISKYLDQIKPAKVWDLGANTGIFTQIAAAKNAECIAFDIDPLAVDANYLYVRDNPGINILPLLMNLTNPSPDLGWDNRERMGLKARPLPDTIMALALIHHLCITHNLPIDKVAEFLAGLSKNLIIEFVPKSDSQVQKLLRSRKDIFDHYSQKEFEHQFSKYYIINALEMVSESKRIIYLMSRKKEHLNN